MVLEVALITALITVASALSAVTGFGTSTISIPILLFFFPLPHVLLFVGIIHFAGAAWRLFLFRKGFVQEFLLLFSLPAMAASYFGARASFLIEPTLASKLLGLFLVMYVGFYLCYPTYHVKQTKTLAVTSGSLSGFFAGIFGLGGAIRSTFLHAFRLPKLQYLFTTNAIAVCIDSVRLTTYVSGGMRLTPLLTISLLCSLPLSLAAAWLAKRYVVDILPLHQFRAVVGLFLGLVGLRLLLLP